MGHRAGARADVIARIVSPLLALLLLGGCSGSGATPRHRIGALPFPGTFTLYRAADPNDLGPHRYARTPRFFQPDERESGIIYTTRAGFLDVAHLRLTIDWTHYYARRVRAAIDARFERFALPALDGETFHVTLNYPDDWHDLDDAQRSALADELALRCGQRLAYQMMTWHELITWFGHRRVLLIDESPSAFTYDDGMSHAIGLRVAERALRGSPDRGNGAVADGSRAPIDWRNGDAAVTAALRAELADLGAVSQAQTDRANDMIARRATAAAECGIDCATAVGARIDWRNGDAAVTAALRAELADLGAVTPAQTDRAARAVEGIWWARGNPLKRQLDVGLSDDAMRPWLVPGLSFAPIDAEPDPIRLPTLADVAGRDCSSFCSIRIQPNIPEAARMRAAVPGAPAQFTGERDLALLLAATRRAMRGQLAADVDRPWPAPRMAPPPSTRPTVELAHHASSPARSSR